MWTAGTIVGDFVVAGGAAGTDYEYDRLVARGCLRILGERPLTISMKPGVERTRNSISVGTNVCADITLAGVNISTDYTPLDLSIAGESTLLLAEDTENKLDATDEAAGIHIGAAKLTIKGNGALEVRGGDRWPGIGGAGNTTLVIDGGDITACGGIGAAGIGGGAGKNGGSITINDGRIIADGGPATSEVGSGTGIGSGSKAVVNDDIITINGGTIYASAGVSDPGYTRGGNAGIGGGEGGNYTNSGCTIVIHGGDITAVGSSDSYGAGAGIGACGSSSNAKSITITGGVISATAGANGGAGIGGGGGNGELKSLSITGGFIEATGTHLLNGSGKANAIGGGAGQLASNLNGVTGAVIIDGAAKTGRVYGNATLAESAVVEPGVTLSIPEDASLTVTTGGILTNRGITKVDGALTESGGSIGGDGEIQYAVAWDLTGVTHDKGTGVTYASSRSGYSATLSASRGYELPELVTVEIGGTPPRYGYAFNKDTGALRIYAVSVNDKVEITAGATLNQYSVSYAAEQHGSITGSRAADYITAYSGTLAPDTGYARPTAITMTMGGADFTDFSYDGATGAIGVEASKILGDIVISGACTPVSYNITYTGMDGAAYGAKHPATHTYDTETEVSDPEKVGYTFAGWKVNGDAAAKSLTLAADGYTADITLEATWTANTYTVRYNGNGSTGGGTAASTHTYDAAKALTGNGFERKYTVTYDHNYSGSVSSSDTAAYTFTGWSESSLGTGASYADRQSVTNLAESGTYALYAKWTPAGVTLPTPSRTGYTFGGWYGEEACTSLVGAGGASYTPTAPVTLYAKWTIKTYAVTLPAAQTGYTLAAKSDSVSPVEHGGDYTFTFALDEDYSASTPTVKVGGTAVTLNADGEYTISNITAAQAITVEDVERNSFAVTQAQLGGAASLEIDGVSCTFTNGTINLPDGTSRVATVITEANSGDSDPHKIYPTSMKVYLLRYDPATGAYTPEHIEAFDDLLLYAGCSIRLTGRYGIRMITSMDDTGRSGLINGDGDWTLMETGTVVAWAGTNSEPTIGGTGCVSNHAYKRGGADPIFKRDGGLVQFTNVLVNDFTREQCLKDFALRPYATFQNASGEEITVYGGALYRSIWYVAKQNEGLYSGAAGEFIDRIIAMRQEA